MRTSEATENLSESLFYEQEEFQDDDSASPAEERVNKKAPSAVFSEGKDFLNIFVLFCEMD